MTEFTPKVCGKGDIYIPEGEYSKQAILEALCYEEFEVSMTDTDGITHKWMMIGRKVD